MSKNGIKEYKLAVKKCLMKKYNMSEIDAHIAVRDSWMSQMLQKDSDFTMHDMPEYWADFIYEELKRIYENRLEM